MQRLGLEKNVSGFAAHIPFGGVQPIFPALRTPAFLSRLLWMLFQCGIDFVHPGWGSSNKIPSFAALILFFVCHVCSNCVWQCSKQKIPRWGDFVCGEGGIRTRDTLLTYTHFPGALLKPLGHLSGIGCKQPSKNTTFGIRKHLFPKAGAKVILVSPNCKRDFVI